MKNKLMLVLPLVLLFSLTSCGGESFTEVTDESKKSETLKTVQSLNKAPSEKVTGVKENTEINLTRSGQKNTVTFTQAAYFSGNYMNSYYEVKDNLNNYEKTYFYYDTKEESFYSIYEACYTSSDSSINVKGAYKHLLNDSVVSEHTATTDSEKNDLVLESADLVTNIFAVISISSDYKIYTGSNGSYKVDDKTDKHTYSLTFSSTGLLTKTESTSTSLNESGTPGDICQTSNLEYNISSTPILKLSDYTLCDLGQFVTDSYSIDKVNSYIMKKADIIIVC